MPNTNSFQKNNDRDANLVEIFDAFCLQIFENRDLMKIQKDEFDFKQMHKLMSGFLKTHLTYDKNLYFHKEIKEAMYMAAVLADEIFLNMDWNGKKFWENNMLEQQFFGTQVAGEVVFEKIDDFVLERHHLFLEKSEIYIKSLLLGFKGKFRGIEDEPEHIGIYLRKLLGALAQSDISVTNLDGPLFQKEYTYTIPSIHRKLLPDAAIITYISSFFVFMFLVISTVVWMLETRDINIMVQEIASIALRDN
ncbi:MAG: DotU family type IV/VI secretion system protein [Holosporaceae bacterium]|jgi:type IV/VI secretion system ImpK/VasF family protein|nr:DotU family type IV/VI secretion system protein [Holosporaceae bacterium]